MLDGRRFHDVVFDVRLPFYRPVAHIPIVRSIDLTDALGDELDALMGLGRHDGGHADAFAFL